MTPNEWADRLFELEYEFVEGEEFSDLTADQKVELMFELGNDDERTTFNSGDLSSDEYSKIYELLHKKVVAR